MHKKTNKDYDLELFNKEIDHNPLEDYAGDGVPILHECINGHVTLRSPGNVLRGSNCTMCANNFKHTDKDYLDKLIKYNITITPVEKYINTDTPIMHKCPIGHEWKVAPKYILNGRNCPACSNKLGYYSIGFFKNNREVASSPGILYCVILVDKNTQERKCIKIGITKGTSNKDVLKRVGHFKGYDTRIQKLVFDSLENVYLLEQHLHNKWKHKKYISEWKFGGYSELFEIDNEIIKDIPLKICPEIIADFPKNNS